MHQVLEIIKNLDRCHMSCGRINRHEFRATAMASQSRMLIQEQVQLICVVIKEQVCGS